MMRRILAMSRKETIHIIRDVRTLYIALIMPVIMILLFGYAVDFDVDQIETGIHDLDKTAESRRFIARLQAGGWFSVVHYAGTQRELERALDRRVIKIGITIPRGYSKKVRRGERSVIGSIIDGSDNNAATVGYNYLQLFMGHFNLGRFQEYSRRTGVVRAGFMEPVPRVFFNPDMKSRFFILPGIIVLTMAILSALLTSLTIAREWERGSMEQLISTPVRPLEIILGKMMPYTVISFIQVSLAAGFAIFVFHVPFRGGYMALYSTSLLFAVGALGLGMLFSSVMRSQLPAMQAALVASMLPSIFLSNFVFPIDSMPALVRLITYIVPAKYYLVMLRTEFLRGTGVGAYIPEVGFLALYCGLVILIAVKKLRKRIA